MVEVTSGCGHEVEGSAIVDWEAGQTYYLQGLLLRTPQCGALKVGVQLPDGTTHMPIPISMFSASFLAPGDLPLLPPPNYSVLTRHLPLPPSLSLSQ